MSPEPQPARSPRKHMAWRLAAVLVTGGSLAWVGTLAMRVWPDLQASLDTLVPLYLGAGLFLSLASSYVLFEAFALIAGLVGVKAIQKKGLAHLHFTGQLLKHLPGRVWGVGYQWVVGRSQGSISVWLLANVSHMLLATFFALWGASVVLAWVRHPVLGLLAGFVGAALYLLLWRLPRYPLVMQSIRRIPGSLGQLGAESLGVLANVPPVSQARLFLAFSGSSVLLYAAWICFGTAYPPLGAAGGAQLCAYYMIAWFVGYIVFVTPSGLGVRELAFAWIAQGFGSDTIALMAILGRVSLLSVDILLGMLFAPFAPRQT